MGRFVFLRRSPSYGHGERLFPVGKETNKPENLLAMNEGETGTKKQMEKAKQETKNKKHELKRKRKKKGSGRNAASQDHPRSRRIKMNFRLDKQQWTI